MHRKYKDYDLSRIKHAKASAVKFRFTLDSIISTFFFVGYFPIASGTMGSLAVYPIFYYLLNHYPADKIVEYLWLLTGFFTIIGWWGVRKYQDATHTFDHKTVVIDEVVGMLFTLALSFNWLYVITKWLSVLIDASTMNLMFLEAFIAFRYFDISKPFIVGVVDRYYKKAFGVILDDILAALMAGGTLYVVNIIVAFFY